MGRRRLLLIANPRAGSGAAESIAESVRMDLVERGLAPELRLTEGPGHAREMARAAGGAGWSGIGVAGGDGTLHEVVNGLMEGEGADPLPLGLLPAGSGNSLARDLGIGRAEEGARRMVAGRTRRIDLMELRLDGRALFSFNAIAWGAAARIADRAERLRWARGARYTLAAVLELLRPRQRDQGGCIAGEERGNWLLGSATVTRYTGNGMLIAPRAVLDDGLIDLVQVSRAWRPRLARILLEVFEGEHASSDLVSYRQVRGFGLDLDPGSRIMVDGELLGARRVEVEVRERALPIFA